MPCAKLEVRWLDKCAINGDREEWVHFGCNLDLEAISLVEGWDGRMAVGGAEEKAGIKEDNQVFTLPTGRVVLPFIELENTGKGMNLGLGTIIS